MTNSFKELLDYTSSAMLITGSLTVMAVIVLRRRLPTLERPYRLGLYPWPPLLYTLSSLIVLVVLVLDGNFSVYISILWFALAIFAHRMIRGQ